MNWRCWVPLNVTVNLAPKLEQVFGGPARYRVAYGGRGSGKSWGFARMALLKMLQNPGQPFFFGRELQNSIRDSVHKLLADQARAMGLSALFDVGVDYFRCKNGAYAIFKGLRTNADAIKSLEGVKYAWIEEAHKLSANSLELLKPTIRAPGSEIWFTYNPENMTDAVHQMFVVNPPPNALVVKINWDDNPWFPAELEEERAFMALNDAETYDYVWNGNCRKYMQGSIYGRAMAAMQDEGRIAKVPYNPAFPVFTAWDLGYGDMTSIGFFQVVGREPRCIDYYENHLEAIDHYVKLVLAKPYTYDMHVLPHDAGHQSLRTGKTLAQQVEDMGLGVQGKTLTVLPVVAINAGIETVRQWLPQLWVDENCKRLVAAMQAYQYEWDEDLLHFKDRPLHDWASHPADMMRYAATYLAMKRPAVAKKPQGPYAGPVTMGWMG